MQFYDSIVRCTIFRKTKAGYEVLLCKRAYTGEWEFPGGSVEPNETPTDAIVREVYEETKLTINVLKLKYIYSLPHPLDPETKPYYMRLYACTDFTGEPTPDQEEVSEVRWVAIANILDLPVTSLTNYLVVSIPAFYKEILHCS